MLAKCDYEECKKYDTCARVHEKGELILFRNICPNLSHKWYIKRDEIVIVDDNKDVK